MESEGASRTAVFVCQGRAVAHGRLAPAVFSDPVATHLLTQEELAPVRLARSGEIPAKGRERFPAQLVAACAEVVTPRTVLIDRAVAEAVEHDPEVQVVLLGAGLDARPWRLAALDGVASFSVDHPASQADLLSRSAGFPEPLGYLQYVPVDLTRQPLGPALRAAGHDPDRATAWVWEGVIPYLTARQVRATLSALSDVSGDGSTLLAQYQAPSVGAALGRRLGGLIARVSGVESPLADEPWKSAWSPEEMAGLLTHGGWTSEDDIDLLTYAERIGSETGHSRSLANGRVVVARR